MWLVDQSNSPGQAYGGRISIFDGKDISGSSASACDAGRRDRSRRRNRCVVHGADRRRIPSGRTWCSSIRPHSHAVLAFVASGHVVFFNAELRMPVACLRASVGSGGRGRRMRHFPRQTTPSVLVANQNGKLLERIHTNYAAESFAFEPAATLNLASCTTPNGFACQDPALRPDNAPICPFVPSGNDATFVSLRGGGLFVVDHKATPMAIVGEYTTSQIEGNGCGFVQARGSVFLNAGGATPSNLDEFAAFRLAHVGLFGREPAEHARARAALSGRFRASRRARHGRDQSSSATSGCSIAPVTSRKCSTRSRARG